MKNKHFVNDDHYRVRKEPEDGLNSTEEHMQNRNHSKSIKGVVDEHCFWLKMKGYDEKGLNNNEPEGMLKKQLKIAIQDIIDSSKVLLDKETFQIHTFGIYGELDKVLYTFNYSFDSFENRLTLNQVEASLNQIPITVAIETFDDLWPSKEMYNHVKRLSQPINEVLKENRLNNIALLAADYSLQLKEKGYEDNSIQAPGWLEKNIRKQLLKAETSPAIKHFFNLKFNLKPKGATPHELTKVSIHFSYYKPDQFVAITGVHAQIGNSKVFVLKNIKDPIVSAVELLDSINKNHSITTAQKLLQNPLDHSNGPRKKQ